MVRTKEEILADWDRFGKKWMEAEKENDFNMASFYEGRFHGVALCLVWVGYITMTKYQEKEKELKENAGVE